MLVELYDRVGESAFCLAARILDKPEDAEDVVSSVFAQVRGEFDDASGDARRAAARVLSLVRQRAIVRRHGNRPPDDIARKHERAAVGIPDATHGDPPGPLTAAQQVRLRQSLAQLPPNERLAIELVFYEGLTQDEVADRMNTSADAVRQKVSQGLEALQGAMRGTS